jgi:hypothetical protein
VFDSTGLQYDILIRVAVNFLRRVDCVITSSCTWNAYSFQGFKVGRVDQAETALGAEMRRTADNKSGGDKLVRRYVFFCCRL